MAKADPFYGETGAVRLAEEQIGKERMSEILFVDIKRAKLGVEVFTAKMIHPGKMPDK